MKILLRYLLLLFLSIAFFTSCTEDEEVLFAEIAEVKLEKVYYNGAEISWTTVNPENAALTFDVYINSELVKKDITEKSIKVSKLKANTVYSGKIIVKANNKISPEKIFTFKTSDNPVPSGFEISLSNINQTDAVVKWTESTVKDSSKITYFLYVNSKLEKGDLTERIYNLKNLTAAKKYNIKIVALSSNGKEISSETVLVTLDYESPTPFDITVSNITTTNALVSWNESTVKDNSNITYSVYINGTLLKENVTERAHLLKNLSPLKQYTVKVIAISGNGKKVIKESIFKTPDYPSPSKVDITVSEITSKSALIKWTSATIKDNSAITYEVYLNNTLVRTELTEIFYTVKNLTPSKKHYVKVVAKSKKGKKTASEISFLTLNAPRPSAPTVSVESTEITPKNTKITWSPSTISEGLTISYKVLLNGNLYKSGITDTNIIFNDLSEGITYKVKIIAVGENSTQTESNQISFTTITYPKVTDFALTSTVNSNSAIINWTMATLNGKNTTYKIRLNNGAYIETNLLTHTFDSLAAGNYTVEVIAKGIYKGMVITKVKKVIFTIV